MPQNIAEVRRGIAEARRAIAEARREGNVGCVWAEGPQQLWPD